MNRKEWLGFVVILAVCAFFCGLYWFVTEGRFAGDRAVPAVTVPTLLPVSNVAPIFAPPPQATNRALVTSVSESAGYQVFVPAPKSAFQKMADGSSRVTFQFEPKDAAAAESLASERGAALYLSVTRGR